MWEPVNPFKPDSTWMRYLDFYVVLTMSTGVLAIVFFSHAFSPPAAPVDVAAASEKSYYNAKAGIWAAIAFYLGAHCRVVILGDSPGPGDLEP